MENNHYEVLIVGAGISGAALAYELARYTDVKSIAILEKYEDVATLNTQGKANSQTITLVTLRPTIPLPKLPLPNRLPRW